MISLETNGLLTFKERNTCIIKYGCVMRRIRMHFNRIKNTDTHTETVIAVIPKFIGQVYQQGRESEQNGIG